MPLIEEEIDGLSGLLFPFYDADTHMLYLAGKVREASFEHECLHCREHMVLCKCSTLSRFAGREARTYTFITTQNSVHLSRTGDKDQNLSAKISCEILIYLDRGLSWAFGGTRLSIPDLMCQHLNMVYTLILCTCILRIGFVEIHATFFLFLKVLREEANCFEQIQEK